MVQLTLLTQSVFLHIVGAIHELFLHKLDDPVPPQ
jgi:hypothetical protein